MKAVEYIFAHKCIQQVQVKETPLSFVGKRHQLTNMHCVADA